MEDDVLGTLNGLEGLFNQVLPSLNQHLDGHVVGDVTSLNQFPADFILRLTGGGEANLDLLHPNVHQRVKILQFFGQIHGVHQGLIAVPQIHGAPDGGLGNHSVGPGAALDGLGGKGNVLFKFGLHGGVLL